MKHPRIAALTLFLLAGCSAAPPPAMPAAPRFPDVPALEVPGGTPATSAALEAHTNAWRRFQSGDLRGAARDYAVALEQSPGFYPAATGLGYVALQERRFDDAAKRFDAALLANATYAPALSGRVDAALSLGDDAAAIAALERWLTLPVAASTREDLAARLDVLRLRAVQTQLAQAAKAKEAGRLDEAKSALDAARAMAPGSAVVLREAARVAALRGAFDEAGVRIKEALAADPSDAETHAASGEISEMQGRPQEAAAAFRRAADLDPRPEWRARAEGLDSAAALAALPAEYRGIPTAASITRAQLAALLGVRLGDEIGRAPRRVTVVLTDVRSHWAASWILPVTRAGLMEPLPNHTFQPAGSVRRADLAQVVWRAIQALGAHRPADLARWRTARADVSDVPRTHLAFTAISAAIASGAMTAADGRFRPNAPVSGPEAVAAVARLEQIAARGAR